MHPSARKPCMSVAAVSNLVLHHMSMVAYIHCIMHANVPCQLGLLTCVVLAECMAPDVLLPQALLACYNTHSKLMQRATPINITQARDSSTALRQLLSTAATPYYLTGSSQSHDDSDSGSDSVDSGRGNSNGGSGIARTSSGEPIGATRLGACSGSMSSICADVPSRSSRRTLIGASRSVSLLRAGTRFADFIAERPTK